MMMMMNDDSDYNDRSDYDYDDIYHDG